MDVVARLEGKGQINTCKQENNYASKNSYIYVFKKTLHLSYVGAFSKIP